MVLAGQKDRQWQRKNIEPHHMIVGGNREKKRQKPQRKKGACCEQSILSKGQGTNKQSAEREAI